MNEEDLVINPNLIFKYNKQDKKPKKQNLIRNIFPFISKNKNKTNEICEILNSNNNNNNNYIEANVQLNSTKNLNFDKFRQDGINNNEFLSISKKNIFAKTPINKRNYGNNLLKDIDFINAAKLYSINKYNYLYNSNIFLNDNDSKQKTSNANLIYKENNLTNNNKDVNCLIINFDYKKPFMKTGYNNFNCIDDLLTKYNSVRNKTLENKYILKKNKNSINYSNTLKNNTKEKNSKNLDMEKCHNTYYSSSCNKKMEIFKEKEEKNNNIPHKSGKGEICRYMEKRNNKKKISMKSNSSTKNKISSVIFGIYKPNRKENNNDDILELLKENK